MEGSGLEKSHSQPEREFLNLPGWQLMQAAVENIDPSASRELTRSLQEILTDPEFRQILAQARTASEAELQSAIAADLQSIYGDLGERCPTTLAALVQNLQLAQTQGERTNGSRDKNTANLLEYYNNCVSVILMFSSLSRLKPTPKITGLISHKKACLARLLLSLKQADLAAMAA